MELNKLLIEYFKLKDKDNEINDLNNKLEEKDNEIDKLLLKYELSDEEEEYDINTNDF